MTVIAWGGAGASAVMLTWHHGRGGPAWRFPWGHYDPCVPDKGTQTPGRALDLIGVTTLRQVQGEARGAAEQAGTEIAGGARVSRHVFIFGRHGLAPRFPTEQWPDGMRTGRGEDGAYPPLDLPVTGMTTSAPTLENPAI